MSNHPGSDDGYIALSYVLAGPLFYGGLGWLGDRWLHTGFLLPVGLMLGIVLSLYTVVKRFGGTTNTTTSAEPTRSAGEESQ